MMENIIQDDLFDNISYNYNFFSPQNDFTNLSFFEQDKDPFTKYFKDFNNIQDFSYEVSFSDIKINPNNNLNLITKTKNTTLLNNKTKREEFNSEGYKNNNETSKNIELEIPNKIIPHIKEKTKKGRKKKSEKNNVNLAEDNNIHTKIKDDNIIIKIKTFFLNNVHKFINGFINDNNMKLKQLDPIIKENIKKDYNIELWNSSLKNIYREGKICKKENIDPYKNIKIIDEIYKNNSDDELIKILDLSFGELFEIFIKNLKEIKSELLAKVENYEIYKNAEFSNLNNFYNKIKNEEKKYGQSDEFIEDYINKIKEKCIDFKAWFDKKSGRERKKKYI